MSDLLYCTGCTVNDKEYFASHAVLHDANPPYTVLGISMGEVAPQDTLETQSTSQCIQDIIPQRKTNLQVGSLYKPLMWMRCKKPHGAEVLICVQEPLSLSDEVTVLYYNMGTPDNENRIDLVGMRVARLMRGPLIGCVGSVGPD